MSLLASRRQAELRRVLSTLRDAREADAKALTVATGDVPAYWDAYRTQRTPSASDLITQFKGLVYACAFLNGQSVAGVARHVYAQTGPGDRGARFWRRRGVKGEELSRLLRLRAVQPGVDVEELLDHPLVNLLERPNPDLSGFALRETTQLYLELTGSAYWRVERDSLRVPSALWLLQSQFVDVIRDPDTNQVIGWRYGQGTRAEVLPVEDVVDFHLPNLQNPYGDGYGPGQAAWESINLVGKDKSNVAALLDNRARPDAIVSPKNEEAGMSVPMATRLEKILQRKFRKGGVGGLLVHGAPLDVSPLTFSQADMEAIARYGINKIEILNQFLVPPAMLESNKSRAELEAAQTQHARSCVNPRCKRVDERISQKLCPMFDDRLFVTSEDAAPEDIERRVLSEESELRTGQSTINEVRARKGREEVDYGTLPWLPVGVQQPIPAAVADSDVGQDVQVTEAAVLNGAQIAAATAIITAVALGQLPRDAGKGQLVVLFNLNDAQAEAMLGAAGTPGFVAVQPSAPAPPKPTAEDEDEDEDEEDAKRVLLALRRAGRTLDLQELAEVVRLPLGRAQAAVNTLAEMGLASRNGERY